MVNNPTPYTISNCGGHRIVWKNSKVVSQGFFDDDSALHSVWVIEGKNPNHFYVQHKGVFSRTNRDEL